MIRQQEHRPYLAQRDRERELAAVTVGPVARLAGQIEIEPYDPTWPSIYELERSRVADALDPLPITVEHVGSTSVPGLAAKPKIDMLLVVPDSSDESTYVPALESVGYSLRIREPDWYEHRVMIGPDFPVNCHVFSPGCIEIERMLAFRNWLRTHPDDRDLYQQTKIDLANREWAFLQDYADAKSEVVEAIIARSLADTLNRE